MKQISGILGASSFLLLLATAGAAMFPENAPNWMIPLGLAVICAVLSVIAFRQSKKSNG
jgi:hypothetical protein